MYGTISYQSIWRRLNQLEVWSDILNTPVSLNQLITNPLRVDTNPSCFLREWNGVILLTDFAYPQYNSYTAIHVIAELYNCSLDEAAKHAANIYLHKLYSLPEGRRKAATGRIIHHNSNKIVRFNPHSIAGEPVFIDRDKDYWQKRHVSSAQLKALNVYSVRSYFIGESLCYATQPAYAYYFPESGHVKIYMPFADKGSKFIGSTDSNDVWKIDRKSNVCLITKSAKDLLVLQNLVDDVDIHAFQSEGATPDDLSEYESYDSIIIFYDNDDTGYRTSKKLSRILPNSRCIYLPSHYNAKDADELIVEWGYDTAKSVVNHLIYASNENAFILEEDSGTPVPYTSNDMDQG